jgi:uncharacterized protein YodC (DUF2158 family)
MPKIQISENTQKVLLWGSVACRYHYRCGEKQER